MNLNSTSSAGQSGMTFSRSKRRRSTLSGAEKMPMSSKGAPVWSFCGQPIVCGWADASSSKSGSSNERAISAAGVCSTSYWSNGGRSIDRTEKEKRTPTTVDRKHSAKRTVRALDRGRRSEYHGRRRGGWAVDDDAAPGPPVSGCDDDDRGSDRPDEGLRERNEKGERGWSEGDTGDGAEGESSIIRRLGRELEEEVLEGGAGIERAGGKPARGGGQEEISLRGTDGSDFLGREKGGGGGC